MDLDFVYGNTNDGMHAANLGATWQAMIHGFCGTRLEKGTLSINPRLPDDWKEVSFCLKLCGYNLRIIINHNKVSLRFRSKRKKDKLDVKVYGASHRLEANKLRIFTKKKR